MRQTGLARFCAMLSLVAVALGVLTSLSAASASHAQNPAILKRVRVDPNRLVDFHAGVYPETLFVGQQATYQVAVLLDEVAGTRLPRNPEYLPPELRGLLAYDLGGQQRFSHDANGKRYTAYVFQKALFPLASGRLTIPSPQLTYALRQSSSYFSREESHTLRAESSSVVVRPVPEEGKPADFTGAVGVFKAVVQLDATTARVGDPLVLTLKVQGSGNIKLLPRPTLEVEWATTVAGTERLQMDTSGAVVKGAKEFDWILTPTRAGDVATPVVTYSYFNPNNRTYEIAQAEPVAFAVNAGSLANAEEGEQSTVALPLRNREVGVVPTAPLERRVVWVMLALLPLPALALFLIGIPRAAPQAPAIETLRSLVQKPAIHSIAAVGSAVGSRTSATETKPTTARDVRRLLIASLARRLEISSDVLTDRKRTNRALRRRGVTRETTDALLAQLGALDLASFSAASIDEVAATRELSSTVLSLYDRVDKEALLPLAQRLKKAKGAASVASMVIVTMLSWAIAVPPVGSQQLPSQGWDAATLAYKNRKFLDAANAFQQLARESPRDADVLANWGTAAWAAGDTVTAVVAWQRAVRLDPLAADLRERMLLLPSGSRDGIAEVPLVPVPALGYAGMAFWTVGWCVAAILMWRRRRGQNAIPALNMFALALVLVGTASAATSMWGTEQLKSRRLAVVLRPETIRANPEVDADALGGAATGDVVRVEEMHALWARVEHSDGRSGWLPADRLTLLANSAQP